VFVSPFSRFLSRVARVAERIILLPFRPFFWFLDVVFWVADRTLKSIAEENHDPEVQKEVEWMMEWWEDSIATSSRYSHVPGNAFSPDP